MKQKGLNNFKRKYFDNSYRANQNSVVHDPGTTAQHRKLVIDICEWAHSRRLVYFTRVFLKNGHIADIVIPQLPYPFIEVRDSEKNKEKEYLSQYQDKMVFVDVDDPFKLK